MTVTGRVIKGRGRGKFAVQDLADPIAAHIGAEPYFGTLNILLRRPLPFRPETAVICDGRHAFWPVTVMDEPMLAHRWTGCPYHAVELVAAGRLRERFGWTDGQEVGADICRARYRGAPVSRAACLDTAVASESGRRL